MKNSVLAGLLFAVLLFQSATAWSDAVLLIHPTLVMFEGNQRSATITLTNRGDETGTFETGWIEYEMSPEGGLRKLDAAAPWSVQPYVRYSPRRVTLAPAESQVIKVALRRRNDVAQGEYYSHFRVLTLNSEDPAVSEANAGGETPDATASVLIKARTAVAIPIIWRNSQETSGATIKTATFDRETKKLTVNVQRNGKLSVRGFLFVIDTKADGNREPLADPVPLVIYPNLGGRTIDITLREEVSLDSLAQGITVVYSPELEVIDPATVIASHAVTP